MLTSSWNQATLNYDPLRRLWEIGAGQGTTRMLYDGLTLIGEYNNAGTVQRRYVHGPGVDEPLAEYDLTSTPTLHFYHADERGSIVATSDSSGAMASVNSYDEYGIPGSGNTGTFQYTGQVWLPQIGMYHYRARIYSPTLGRFMQTDPIGYGDGMNLHAYVGNDPVNGTDPSGLSGGGGICTGTRICPSGQNGGVSPAYSGYSLLGGYFERIRSDGPATSGPGDSIVVTSSFRWVSEGFDLSGLRGSLSLASDTVERAITPESIADAAQQLCEVARRVVTSSPGDVAADALIGLFIGDRAGRASAAAMERWMRSESVIGSVVRTGRSAAIGARAGSAGKIVGAAVGAILGAYYNREIEDFMNNMCSMAAGR